MEDKAVQNYEAMYENTIAENKDLRDMLKDCDNRILIAEERASSLSEENKALKDRLSFLSGKIEAYENVIKTTF